MFTNATTITHGTEKKKRSAKVTNEKDRMWKRNREAEEKNSTRRREGKKT